MADKLDVQGMLNVAFTRARDEVHVFHSALIDAFTFADGRPSALTDWLAHCAAVQLTPRPRQVGSRIGQIDSEFEADVAAALRERGVEVIHQYPACGFRVDLVCERNGFRVAVECDGERYHVDEHGQLRIEDLERQAILERAGWRVVRIPYRKWISDAGREVQRIMAALTEEAEEPLEEAEVGEQDPAPIDNTALAAARDGRTERVTREEAAILQAVRRGLSDQESVFRSVRESLRIQRLGARLRRSLETSAKDLAGCGLLVIEDGEYFATADGRSVNLEIAGTALPASERRSMRRGRAFRRPRPVRSRSNSQNFVSPDHPLTTSPDLDWAQMGAEFRVGQRVTHPEFGSGMVQAVEGSGDRTKLSVHFDRVGMKKLMARYAPLRSIDRP